MRNSGIQLSNSKMSCTPIYVLLLILCVIGMFPHAAPVEAKLFAYVSNGGAGTVSVIDVALHSVIATVTVGGSPTDVAVAPDGTHAYVTVDGSFPGTVAVIDTDSHSVVATIPVGNNPNAIAVAPDGGHVYVTNNSSNVISVISTLTNTVTATIPVGFAYHSIAVTPDSRTAYAVNGLSDSIAVLDLVSNTIRTTLNQRGSPSGVAISRDGTRAYVAITASKDLIAYNTSTNTTIRVVTAGPFPWRTDLSVDGSLAYTANLGDNTVTVAQTIAPGSLIATIPIGGLPTDIALSPDGTLAYVTNSTGDAVSIISTTSDTVIGTIPVEDRPTAIAFADVNSDPDLSISKVIITQAVFDADIDRDGRFDLVQGRETALLVTVHAQGLKAKISTQVEARLGNAKAFTFVDLNNDEEKEVVLFFTPMEPGDKDLLVEIDPQKSIMEADRTNNQVSSPVSIKTMKRFVAPYVLIASCGALDCYGPPVESITDHIQNSSAFIQATYPVADHGFVGKKVPLNIFGASTNFLYLGIRLDFHSTYAAAKRYDGEAKRGIGIVPKGYFAYHGRCQIYNGKQRCANGMTGGGTAVLVEEGHWTVAAHELGHTLGLGEEYTINSDGIKTSGYWISEGLRVENTLGFMGIGPAPKIALDPTPVRWVTNQNWAVLASALASTAPDPELLLIGGLLHPNGTVELFPLHTMRGTPDIPKPGSYTVRLSDQTGKTLSSLPFDVSFTLHAIPFEPENTNIGSFTFAIPYPSETAKVSIEAPNGSTLIRFNPISKMLLDNAQAIPDACFTNISPQQRVELHNKLIVLQNVLDSGNIPGAIQKLQQDMVLYVQDNLKDGCERVNALDVSKDDLLELLDDAVKRISTFDTIPGDLDGDGDVDQNDLNTLLKDRNKTVSQSTCGVACDFDGDGKITALDSRKLTLLCTRTRCATQ